MKLTGLKGYFQHFLIASVDSAILIKEVQNWVSFSVVLITGLITIVKALIELKKAWKIFREKRKNKKN